MPQRFHLAQVNIARLRAPIDDPLLAGFVARLDDVNALADAAPGFVWRLQTDAGNATALRPYDDDRILFNLSVWESPERLRDFVYRSAHVEVMRQRKSWFERFDGPYYALWWVPAGHIPSIDEAKASASSTFERMARARIRFPSPSSIRRPTRWTKLRSRALGRRGTINIQWNGATKVLSCRVVNKGSGKPNLVIGDFVNYLFQRHRRRIRLVTVLPPAAS